METRFLKPAKDMLVRLENATRHLLAEGEHVTMSAYWRRRLRDGFVTDMPSTRRSRRKEF